MQKLLHHKTPHIENPLPLAICVLLKPRIALSFLAGPQQPRIPEKFEASVLGAGAFLGNPYAHGGSDVNHRTVLLQFLRPLVPRNVPEADTCLLDELLRNGSSVFHGFQYRVEKTGSKRFQAITEIHGILHVNGKRSSESIQILHLCFTFCPQLVLTILRHCAD